jgi:hypothetical protein
MRSQVISLNHLPFFMFPVVYYSRLQRNLLRLQFKPLDKLFSLRDRASKLFPGKFSKQESKKHKN